MTEPAKIDPDAWYDDNALHALGFSTGAVARARKTGELRHRKAGKGGRAIYLGRWLSAWLAGEDAPSNREPAGVAG